MPPKTSGVASKAKRAGARTVEVGMLAMLLALQATIGGGLDAGGTLLHNARGSLGNMWSASQGARYVVDANAAIMEQKKVAADDDEDEDEDELHAAAAHAESDPSQAVRTESAAPSPTNASFISEAASCAGSCGTMTVLGTSSNHNAAAIVMAAFAAPLAHAAKGATAAAKAATAAGGSKTVLDHIVSFLPWRDAARARQTSRIVQRAVEESVVRFFRLPKTQAPAAFVYAQCAFDAAAEQLLEASLARDHGRWVCTLCGYDNLGRRVVCGNKQCQLPAPHMRGVVRLFMGQLRRDGTAPFLRWLLEDVIADPTTAPIRLRCVEAHRDPHTQRGKGCGWAYLDDGAMVQRVVAAHKRIFPDVDATGREGVWFVPPEFKDALVEEIDHNIAYAPGRPQTLPRGPFVVENPASGNGAPQPAAVPAAFSSRCGNADIVAPAGVAAEVPPSSAVAATLAAPAPVEAPKVAAAVPSMTMAAPTVPMPGQAQLAAHYHATVAHMQHAMRAAAAAAPGRVYTTLPPLQAPAFRALDDPCYVPRPRVVYRNEPYAASAAAAAVARQFQPALDFLGSQLHVQPFPAPSVVA